jgi:succinate-semialdehyde dehydrogenase/glutarate-semialdehyde dehydrogenase
MISLKDPTLLRQACFIDGRWEASTGRPIEVRNPADGSLVGLVPRLGAQETRLAIEAAARAQKEWAARSAKERSDLLRRWFDLILAAKDDLALILTSEQGKPLAEAQGEIAYGASFIEWFAEQARRDNGDIAPASQRDKRIVVLRQAIGVCAAITPWNFPNAMLTRKLGPALAAGCAVVVKPASQTPFSALALAELAQRAGIPDGIVNVVTGNASEIAGELATNTLVRKISFTGSTEVGRSLMSECASTIKKLSLELGGNAPFIVFEDADLDSAVEGALIAKFRNNGQTCVCANRFYVQRSVYKAFAEKLIKSVSQLTVGPGTEAGVHLGPLIDAKAVTKVAEHIADAVQNGASVAHGGTALGGNFYEPTVLTGVTQEMLITREETFGPVAPLIPFDTESEVIAAANNTEFGLASYVYTESLKRSWRVSEALESGMVGLNTGLISMAEAPFGGVKQSGLGREGSVYGMGDYTELKYVCVGL